MKPGNIERIGIFLVPDGKRPKSIHDHGLPGVNVPFQGTNTFVTIDDKAYNRLHGPRKRVLSELSDFITDQLRADIPHLGSKTLFLNVGMEPPPQNLPYLETARARKIVEALSQELAGLRSAFAQAGADLDVVVRFASEMNLGAYNIAPADHPYSLYKDSFTRVGQTLKAADSNIKMSFSPGLNFQGKHNHIAKFWPGVENVDLVGGTFYMNGATADSSIEMTIAQICRYLADYRPYGLPFVVDEVGSWDPINRDNNRFTQAMIEAIGAFGPEVHVSYLSLFYSNGPNSAKNYNRNPSPTFLNP